MNATQPFPDEADADTQVRAERARLWFGELRDRFVTAFEALEDEAPETLFPGAPGRFALTPWTREGGGGGVMGMLRGRLFEKCGVHVSQVFGRFTPEMAETIPGAHEDPRFVATGVSLIAHMASPRVPAVHMNTRYIATTSGWFGGGADLTPLPADQPRADTAHSRAFPPPLRRPGHDHDPR